MSLPALRWAFQQPAKGPAKTVLVCIAWRAQGDGSAQVSIAALAEDAGLSPRAVQSAIYKLIAAGYLDADRSHRAVSTYRLLHAPRASGTTTTVLQHAPRASYDYLAKVRAKAYDAGVKTGRKLEREDIQRRSTRPPR